MRLWRLSASAYADRSTAGTGSGTTVDGTGEAAR